MTTNENKIEEERIKLFQSRVRVSNLRPPIRITLFLPLDQKLILNFTIQY